MLCRSRPSPCGQVCLYPGAACTEVVGTPPSVTPPAVAIPRASPVSRSCLILAPSLVSDLGVGAGAGGGGQGGIVKRAGEARDTGGGWGLGR